jgi:hypothetical protein
MPRGRTNDFLTVIFFPQNLFQEQQRREQTPKEKLSTLAHLRDKMKCCLVRRLASSSRSAASHGVTAGTKWVSTFRYGFEGSPIFGCFTDNSHQQDVGGGSTARQAAASADLLQRYVYCKALVYASCGGRLARDWIAGCAALSLSDAELVSLALQYDATKDDLTRLQSLLLQRRHAFDVEEKQQQQQRAEDDQGTSSGSSSTNKAAVATTEGGKKDASRENISGKLTPPIPEFFPHGFRTPSLSALSPGSSHPDDDAEPQFRALSKGEADTILRCFVYDAVKAASFHTSSLLPEQVLHLEHVCAVLGLADGGDALLPDAAYSTTTTTRSALPRHNTDASDDGCESPQPTVVTPVVFLQAAIDIVREENAIMKEKFRVIEQQGSRH